MKVRAKIVSFDERTWWGVAQYDLTTVEFHGTSVAGFTSDVKLDGLECDLLFNDAGRLYDVRVLEAR